MIGRETLAILPLEGAEAGTAGSVVVSVVSADSVAPVVVAGSVASVEESPADSVASVVVSPAGPVASVVVSSALRSAKQVLTSVAEVSSLAQQDAKTASGNNIYHVSRLKHNNKKFTTNYCEARIQHPNGNTTIYSHSTCEKAPGINMVI